MSFHPLMNLHYRNKRDVQIFMDTYTNNTYQFPDKMEGIALDIGGHIGSASKAMAERGAKVFAFEPCKETYEMLIKNVAELDVTCFNLGVGTPGERELFIHDWDSGSNSFNKIEEEHHKSEKIKAISLTEAIKLAGGVKYIKLDCEGCEWEMLDELKDLDVKIFAEIHCRPEDIVDKFCKPIKKGWEMLNPNVYKLW